MRCLSFSPGCSRRFCAGCRALLNDRTVPWMLFLIGMSCAALATAFASGCAARTVLVPESAPIRIGPETRARVYVRVDGEWILGDNRVTVPEGWYAVPPSFVEAAE